MAAVWIGLAAIALMVGPARLEAAELGGTKITAVRNAVDHKDPQALKPADVGQTVTQGESVLTREQSLAELVADDSSVIRLGAHSVFSYNSKERIVKLDKGTMLMHTPPGNGGATIESGGVTGAISGTTFMLTASPAKCSECKQELQVNNAGKVLCVDHPNNPPTSGGFALIVLEGSSVTKVTGADGQTVAVQPGQMAVVGPKGSGAPQVYAVNITQIARTSPLINAFPNPLPSLPQIIATAYQLQGQNLNTTGTSAVAISSGGQLLTAASPPPNPFLQTFTMASSQPGQNNSTGTGNLANIATAAGGGGGGGMPTPTGTAPVGGGGPSLPTLPGSINTANTTGQQGVAGNPTAISATATVAAKEYDGTTAATLTGAALTGSANNVSLANDTAGTFASKNAGSGIVVTTGMTLTGSGASLYRFTAPTLSGTILARNLTVTAPTIAPKVYDGTATAGIVTVGTLGNLVGTETVTVVASAGNYTSANVGSYSTAVTYTLGNGANGGLASNYSLAAGTATGTITAKALSVAAPTIASKVYDGTATAGTVTVGTLSGFVGAETVTATGTAANYSSANVGSYGSAVTYTLADGLNGGLASNYSLAADTATGIITARPITVTADALTKVYGQTDPGLTYQVTTGNLVTGDSLLGGLNRVAGENVGLYAIGQGTLGNGNYGITYVGDSLTITAKALSVAAPTIASKVYDGTATAGTVTVGTLSGFVGSETVTATGTAANYSSANVGSYGSAVTYTLADGLNGGLASNYSLAADTATGQITAKNITMSSSTVSKQYDGTTTATVTLGTLAGLVGSEQLQVSVAGGTGTGSFSSQDVGGSGTVSVTYQLADDLVTGGLVSNYNLTNPTESLTGTITQRTLTMTGTTIQSREYDGSTTAGAVTVGTAGNLVSGENLTVTLNSVANFTSADVGTENLTVTYTLADGVGGKGSNYQLANQTINGAITKRTLTMAGTTIQSREYDGTTTAGTVTVGTEGNMVAGEALVITGAGSNFTSADVSTENLTVTYTLADGLGGKASNYQLAGQSISGAITKRTLTMTGTTIQSREYDGTTTAGTVTVGTEGNMVAGEALVITGAGSNFTSADVSTENLTVTYTLADGLGGKASNYQLANQSVSGAITKRTLTMTGTTIGSREYDGTTTAGTVTVGTEGNMVAGEALVITGAGSNFTSADVSTENLTVTYTLADGLGGKASNYQLANQTINGAITKRTLTMAGTTIQSREYDGTTTAGTVTVGTEGNMVAGEALVITGAGANFSSKNVGSENLAVTYTLGDGVGGKASNYQLAGQTVSGSITTRTLTITGSSAASRTYDGTVTAGVTPGTLGNLASGETLGTTTAAGTFADRHVGTGKSVTAVYTLADGANPAHLASNYNLANGTLTADITAKNLTVVGTAVTAKAYDGTTAATLTGAGFQSAIAAGTGSSTDGKPYSVDSVTLSGGGAGVFERNLPGTMIPVSTTMSVTGSGAGNYTLTQPTTLKGEITGSATLDRNGAAISVASNPDIHIRNTTATRMQNGLTISSATGSVLLENSSFDGWMQRSTPGTKIDDGGAVTFQFTEGAAVAVNSPVLRLKMEANNPAAAPSAGGANLDYMLLGDYQLHLRHDPDGIANNGDEAATTVFSFPGKATDPNGIGSLAPSADLVIRDSALTQMKDLPWDTQSFSSLDVNGEAVASGSYATAAGEYKPDGPAAMSDLNTTTSAGKWDVTVSDPALGGEGKVTDLRLKYNNNTKALIEGPDGVRLVNVKFEGMDEVEVKADLNNRILMSGTLVSDPNISKMVVKAGTKLEAFLNSDATFKEVKSLSNAELLAGVRYNNTTGLMEFIPGAERTLQIDGPGAAAATPNINIAGQLAIAAHTVVFNNANIASDGVIGVRTRDGMVNRTYGTVVPGTTSFMGANGNYFLNRGNSTSMTIGNSGDIASAFTGGKLTDVGSGGTGTVMNVGKVQ